MRLAVPQAAPAAQRPAIQLKTRIGPVDDPLEREADRVADQVMRMPAPEVSVTAAPTQIRRMCEGCEDEEKLQRKEAGPQAATSEAPATVQEVLRSPGQPLDDATRAYFEPRFGQDFSGVRVHTGAAADQSVRDVHAWAYTVGRDIAFGECRFAPETRQGRRLLAHELTHVVQQSGEAYGKKPMPGLHNVLSVSEPGDRYEQEADRVAQTMMRVPDPDIAEQEKNRDEEVALQRDSSIALKAAGVSLQSRPKIMRLTSERFRERLGRTDDQKEVIDALFANAEFRSYWDWLGACSEDGAHGPIKLRVRRTWEGGLQTFGEFKWDSGTLIINPWKRDVIANPQELVDTIVHELFHAIHWAVDAGKCPQKEPPLARLGFKKGSARELKDVKGSMEEIEQFERAGPSASDPCRGFIDIPEAPQRAIVRIVSETIEQTRIGGSTRTRANEILRLDIRNARGKGATNYAQFLEQAPVLAEFIRCRDSACFEEPCSDEMEGMQCPLRPRRHREHDIETCFQQVLSAEASGRPFANAT